MKENELQTNDSPKSDAKKEWVSPEILPIEINGGKIAGSETSLFFGS